MITPNDTIATVTAYGGTLTTVLAVGLVLTPLEWRRLAFHLKRAARTFTREGGRANFIWTITRLEVSA